MGARARQRICTGSICQTHSPSGLDVASTYRRTSREMIPSAALSWLQLAKKKKRSDCQEGFSCPFSDARVRRGWFLWLGSSGWFRWLVRSAARLWRASISTVYFICSVIATTKANNLAVAGVLRGCGVLPGGWRGPQERWKE